MSTNLDPPVAPGAKNAVPPSPGEVITSLATGTTYTMGESIGEGSFGLVFACTDGWRNDLAVKVMKPIRSYEEVQAATMAEVQRLLLLRHPHITYVYDAFEYRDTLRHTRFHGHMVRGQQSFLHTASDSRNRVFDVAVLDYKTLQSTRRGRFLPRPGS